MQPIFYALIVTCIGAWYIMFPRPINNAVMAIFRKKSYVICHFKYKALKISETYLVVPDKNGFGTIKGLKYNLNKEHAMPFDLLERLGFKGLNRLHFLINEGNSEPEHVGDIRVEKVEIVIPNEIKEDKDKTITFLKEQLSIAIGKVMFPAHELSTTLQNVAADFLYTQKKDYTKLILIILVIASIAMSVYAIKTIQDANTLLNLIYTTTHPQGINGTIAIIGN